MDAEMLKQRIVPVEWREHCEPGRMHKSGGRGEEFVLPYSVQKHLDKIHGMHCVGFGPGAAAGYALHSQVGVPHCVGNVLLFESNR